MYEQIGSYDIFLLGCLNDRPDMSARRDEAKYGRVVFVECFYYQFLFVFQELETKGPAVASATEKTHFSYSVPDTLFEALSDRFETASVDFLLRLCQLPGSSAQEGHIRVLKLSSVHPLEQGGVNIAADNIKKFMEIFVN